VTRIFRKDIDICNLYKRLGVELQVNGIRDGDCYELVDTVVGSSILPWRPVIESTFTENSNEAVNLVVERLPGSFPHGGYYLFPLSFFVHDFKIIDKSSCLSTGESPTSIAEAVEVEVKLCMKPSNKIIYPCA
jgi:hypothetical protein